MDVKTTAQKPRSFRIIHVMMRRVAFFHPDLGIGGAERLIIEIAMALEKSGHYVCIFTSHHDPSHCFEETKSGSLLPVCKGDWIPRSLFGCFMAYLAAIRMLYLCIYFLIYERYSFDVVVLDQISVVLAPILRYAGYIVVYYCHYPDLLLTTRDTFIKRLYRQPIDYLESISTGYCHSVLVNSNFTLSAALQAFPTLRKLNEKDDICIDVVYPCVSSLMYSKSLKPIELDEIPQCNNNICTYLFLSINRYERKKRLELTLEAMASLRETLTPEIWDQCHLILMGGHDSRLKENVEYLEELHFLAQRLKLIGSTPNSERDKVTFMKNPSDLVKRGLLQRALCLLYTPENEHFGIVPVEAMMMGVPPIVQGSGGPIETVMHERTGFHAKPDPQSFAYYMKLLIDNPETRAKMSCEAYSYATSRFSDDNLRLRIKTVFSRLEKQQQSIKT